MTRLIAIVSGVTMLVALLRTVALGMLVVSITLRRMPIALLRSALVMLVVSIGRVMPVALRVPIALRMSVALLRSDALVVLVLPIALMVPITLLRSDALVVLVLPIVRVVPIALMVAIALLVPFLMRIKAFIRSGTMLPRTLPVLVMVLVVPSQVLDGVGALLAELW